MDSQIQKCKDSRIHGFADLWIHKLWIHGFTVPRTHRFTDVRIHGLVGLMDSSICGLTDLRIHGCMDSRIQEWFTDPRCIDSRIHGVTDLWIENSQAHEFWDMRITDSWIL